MLRPLNLDIEKIVVKFSLVKRHENQAGTGKGATKVFSGMFQRFSMYKGKSFSRYPWRIFGGWADRLEVILPWAGYLVFVLSGATTSSMGLLRAEDPSAPFSGMLGNPLPIRSDEWLSQGPVELGTLINGSSMTSPLAHSPDLVFQLPSGSFMGSIFFFDGNFLRLGSWLPDAMLFSAYRAFPWLLLTLFLPPLLRRLGANRPMSWLAVVLCFLTPVNIWWSFTPARILGMTATGCYLLILAKDHIGKKNWVRGLLAAGVGGLFLARLVTTYAPWSLVIGLPLVLAVLVFLVWERIGRRSAVIAIGMGAAVGLLLFVGLLWENWGAFQAELSTVYPGQRRVANALVSPQALLGAPGLFGLNKNAALVPSENQSEVTSAYLVCGLVAVLLWPAIRRRLPKREKAAIAVLALGTLVWLSWTIFYFGSAGHVIPVLNRVPSTRAVQVVGIPATILMCLVISALSKQQKHHKVKSTTTTDHRFRPFAIAAAVLVVTGFGVGNLKTWWPTLPAWQIWLSTVAMAGFVWSFVRFPRRWQPVALAALAGLISFGLTNPIMFGLGPVRTSHAAHLARTMRAHLKSDDTLAVTDSLMADALFLANGVPMLSGHQTTGPVQQEWKIIDPTGKYENSWNRGASYLTFDFSQETTGLPEVVNPGEDIIQVKTNACWLADSSFKVSRIVSTQILNSPCVTKTGTFVWYGLKMRIYAVHEP